MIVTGETFTNEDKLLDNQDLAFLLQINCDDNALEDLFYQTINSKLIYHLLQVRYNHHRNT